MSDLSLPARVVIFLTFFFVFTAAFLMWVVWYVDKYRDDLDKQRAELKEATAELGGSLREVFEPILFWIQKHLRVVVVLIAVWIGAVISWELLA